VGHAPSDAARKALEKHARADRKKQSCHRFAERLGLIGAIVRAPKDLSTGKRHFRGFGKHLK
jgi:hypothetical protein